MTLAGAEEGCLLLNALPMSWTRCRQLGDLVEDTVPFPSTAQCAEQAALGNKESVCVL